MAASRIRIKAIIKHSYYFMKQQEKARGDPLCTQVLLTQLFIKINCGSFMSFIGVLQEHFRLSKEQYPHQYLHINFKSRLQLQYILSLSLPQSHGRERAVPRQTPSLQTFSKALGGSWDPAKPRLSYVTELVTWNSLRMSHSSHQLRFPQGTFPSSICYVYCCIVYFVSS